MEQATHLRLEVMNRVPEEQAKLVRQLHELHDKDVSSLRDLHDKDVSSLQTSHNAGFHSEREIITSRIANVSAVMDERFNAVDTRFQERDTRTEQAAQESRISLDAALAAAKEAVGEQNKSNTEKINVAGLVTQKQIDSLVTLMQTSNSAATDKIDDLKAGVSALGARIDRGEAGYNGAREDRTEHRADSTLILGIIGAILFLISVGLSIAVAFKH